MSSSISRFSMKPDELRRYVCPIVPLLKSDLHKGQCGRVGVVGGSEMYTGAPFFAAMGALKLGADIAFVVTTKEAAPVIKSYSPELMVLPYLDTAHDAVEICNFLLPRIQSLVIGPGIMLMDSTTQRVVIEIIEKTRIVDKPIIFDATVFPLLRNNLQLIRGYKETILTPNAAEFRDLYLAVCRRTCSEINPDAVKLLANELGNVTVLCKGPNDIISDGVTLSISEEQGCPRRCGGQGDILAGVLGTFVAWAMLYQTRERRTNHGVYAPLIIAACGASAVTRRSAQIAFYRLRRSVLASDILGEIHEGFRELFFEM